MAKRKSEEEHKELIRELVTTLEENGFVRIKADGLEGYERTEVVPSYNDETDHRPDVTSFKEGMTYLFEVETADSIDHEHTIMQWDTFANEASIFEYKEFYVVVPEGSEKAARSRLKELGFKGDVMGV